MPSYKDWKERIEEKSNNETAFRLESRTVDRGERWCAQRIAVSDTDGAVEPITLAIRRVGYDHVFDYVAELGAGEWFINKDPVYLMEGEKLVAILGDTTTDEKCKMHITGYKEKLKG